MKYVPHWVVDALMSKKFKCHHCQKVFTHKNMRGLGIRESIEEPDRETFFIELSCNECRKVTFFEMQDMNIVELAEEICAEIDADLDELEDAENDFNEEDMFKDKKINKKSSQKKPTPKKQEKKETSRITLKNVREVKKVLKPEDFKHESFLELMGMPPEEIALYREKE